jgi:hypothetical protein
MACSRRARYDPDRRRAPAMDLERVKRIVLAPKQEWQAIATEATTIPDLYKNYIVILAAIGPVASLIGMSLIGMRVPGMGLYRVSIGGAITSAVTHYVLTLAGVYVLAVIIDALAPTFAGKKSLDQAFKVATYSSIPAWLSGVFAIVPPLGILGILGLYSLYVLFLGLPVLMRSPEERSMGYTAAVVVAAVVVFMVIGLISRAFVY